MPLANTFPIDCILAITNALTISTCFILFDEKVARDLPSHEHT